MTVHQQVGAMLKQSTELRFSIIGVPGTAFLSHAQVKAILATFGVVVNQQDTLAGTSDAAQRAVDITAHTIRYTCIQLVASLEGPTGIMLAVEGDPGSARS